MRRPDGAARLCGVTAVAVIGGAGNVTNRVLVAAWRSFGISAELLAPSEAYARLGPGDVALGRVDVSQTVDGVEPGLLDLLLLERRGVDVRNGAAALLTAHDKLRTAARLAEAGIAHPRTGLVRRPDDPLPVSPPLVVKPRFGSWGKDVVRCETETAARSALRELAQRSWFHRHGALVQEFLPSSRRDVRVVVAGRTVVGACMRVARPGEWRTNVTLGAERVSIAPDRAAQRLATSAVRALGLDLAGVDLLPLPTGRYVVIELNGAVDFDRDYSLAGRDVFADVARALDLHADDLDGSLAPRPGDEIEVAAGG
jgi:ribosomal protein S6--L-glutamate ligase